MFNFVQNLPVPLLLLIATTLEVCGDAVVRVAIYRNSGLGRLTLLGAGALLLLGYGSILNTAPVDFGRVVGLYIATLFIVWQVISFLVFRSLPSASGCVGGLLIIAGGIIVTFGQLK